MIDHIEMTTDEAMENVMNEESLHWIVSIEDSSMKTPDTIYQIVNWIGLKLFS